MSKTTLEKLSDKMNHLIYCSTLSQLHERNISLLSALYDGMSEEYAEALLRLSNVIIENVTEKPNSFVFEDFKTINDVCKKFSNELISKALPAIMKSRREELELAFKSLKLEPEFEYIFEETPGPDLLMRVLKDKGLDGSSIFAVVQAIQTISKTIFIELMTDSEYERVELFCKFACIIVLTRCEALQKAIADADAILSNINVDKDDLYEHLFTKGSGPTTH